MVGIVYTPTIAICGKALTYYPEHSLSVRGGQSQTFHPIQLCYDWQGFRGHFHPSLPRADCWLVGH